MSENTLTITTDIAAPAETCFALACDIDFLTHAIPDAPERIIAGKTTGSLLLGNTVTWRATHFGIEQDFTVQITAYEKPTFLQHAMTKGAFKSFVHDHHFQQTQPNHTRMTDIIRYQVPMWAIGRLVGAAVMDTYLTKLITQRCNAIKLHAEKQNA